MNPKRELTEEQLLKYYANLITESVSYGFDQSEDGVLSVYVRSSEEYWDYDGPDEYLELDYNDEYFLGEHVVDAYLRFEINLYDGIIILPDNNLTVEIDDSQHNIFHSKTYYFSDVNLSKSLKKIIYRINDNLRNKLQEWIEKHNFQTKPPLLEDPLFKVVKILNETL